MKTSMGMDKGMGKGIYKSMGAKWDSPAKVWYVSGDLYRQNPDQWAQFNPAPVTAPACPF